MKQGCYLIRGGDPEEYMNRAKTYRKNLQNPDSYSTLFSIVEDTMLMYKFVQDLTQDL